MLTSLKSFKKDWALYKKYIIEKDEFKIFIKNGSLTNVPERKKLKYRNHGVPESRSQGIF